MSTFGLLARDFSIASRRHGTAHERFASAERALAATDKELTAARETLAAWALRGGLVVGGERFAYCEGDVVRVRRLKDGAVVVDLVPVTNCDSAPLEVEG